MVLTLDVGNTRLSAGVFSQNKIIHSFYCASLDIVSQDKLEKLIRAELIKNNIDIGLITDIAYCSVVPVINQNIKDSCKNICGKEPLFINSKINTGLKIDYVNPEKLGSDRLAAAIGASALYPDKNLIVVDMGTATTIDAVTKKGDFLGGAILPGLNIMMRALSAGTALLPQVEIEKPENACGNNTENCIQSGLFYGALGGIRELIMHYTNTIFKNEAPLIIATGGLSGLFKNEKIFNQINENLVLEGLNKAVQLNQLKKS